MLRACLANPGVCTSFESWGFTDAVTWLTGSRCKGAADCHPLPFDEQYQPKPAAVAMLKVLQQHTAATEQPTDDTTMVGHTVEPKVAWVWSDAAPHRQNSEWNETVHRTPYARLWP